VFGALAHFVEQPSLRWRAYWWPPGRFAFSPFRIQVGEDLLDHHRVFDAGDDPHCPAAGRAGLKAAGLRLIDETPRKGAHGTTIAFVHPAATGGVLTELVQDAEHGH